MSFACVKKGADIPQSFNVVIEIPMHATGVKYEVDKESGTLQVDRFLGTSMTYPANYGYIPETLSLDGDPVDVLVVTPMPLVHGCVIKCRAVGVLKMTDESGIDAKILAVPVTKVTSLYDDVVDYQAFPSITLKAIEHFFTHYKDLENNKWVKIEGWEGIESAHKEIIDSAARYTQEAHDKTCA